MNVFKKVSRLTKKFGIDEKIFFKNSPIYSFYLDDDIDAGWGTRDVAKLKDSMPHSCFTIYANLRNEEEALFSYREQNDDTLVIFVAASLRNYENDLLLAQFQILPDGRYIVEHIISTDVKNDNYQVMNLDDKKSIEAAKQILGCPALALKELIRALNSGYTVMSKDTISYKISSSKEKAKYQSRDITYISTKKFIKSDKAPARYRQIVWSHSWVVRGHWRRLSTLSVGKDRDGNRGVIGKTWITEGVKQKELPTKNKIRIVKNNG